MYVKDIFLKEGRKNEDTVARKFAFFTPFFIKMSFSKQCFYYFTIVIPEKKHRGHKFYLQRHKAKYLAWDLTNLKILFKSLTSQVLLQKSFQENS